MTVGEIATTIFYILDVTLPWPSPIEVVQHQNIAVCLCSTFVTLNHNFIEIHTELCFAKYQWQQYIAYSLLSWILRYVSHDTFLKFIMSTLLALTGLCALSIAVGSGGIDVQQSPAGFLLLGNSQRCWGRNSLLKVR